jgi:hypothetical protein
VVERRKSSRLFCLLPCMPCSIVGSYQSNGVVHPRRECYLIKAQRRLSAALHMCPLRHGSLREFRRCTSCPFHRNEMIAHQKPSTSLFDTSAILFPSQSASSLSSSFKNPPFRFSHFHHIFHDPSPVPSRASPHLASIPIASKSLLRNNAWQPKSAKLTPSSVSHSTFWQLQRRRASCNYACPSPRSVVLMLANASQCHLCDPTLLEARP